MAVLYRWLGINAILISGLIHLFNAPVEFRGAGYLSTLFYAHFLGATIATIGISWGGHLWGWVLGGALAAGAIIEYLFSRMVGLPTIGITSWGPSLAYFSIFIELIFFIPFLASYRLNVRKTKWLIYR